MISRLIQGINLKKCLNKMEANGKLIKILDKEQGTSKAGKQWVKQSFVIETDSQYNNEICFELFGEEKIGMLNHDIGSTLNVKFNLSSREYKGRYYTQAQAWRIEGQVSEGLSEEKVDELEIKHKNYE